MAEETNKKAESPEVKGNVETKKEEKVELSREYIVPLRRGFSVAPEYKRAKKAILVLKQFIAKHMKVENRDISLVRIDKYLNHEIWFRGIKKPLAKVKVKAVKKGGIVFVELSELPKYVQFKKSKEENRNDKVIKTEIKHEKSNDHIEESNKENKKDEQEKDKAVEEAGLKENKNLAKAKKHSTASGHEKKVQPRRQVLQK